LALFDAERVDLEAIHGQGTFPPFKALEEIIELELARWRQTDEQAKSKLLKLMKKSGTLSINDWVTAVTTFGLDPDSVAKISNSPVPDDLYCKISEF